MFTGLVEETGTVAVVAPGRKSIRLSVDSKICAKGTAVGDSIAVNGCCLTVVGASRQGGGKRFDFDLLHETWQRTNLHATRPGASVNLERALRLEDRMGGHFVTGHIDGTGTIRRWEQVGQDWLLEVEGTTDLMRYMLFKGAVALDGISLTLAEVGQNSFRIWIIPHTYQVTALRERRVGDLVNVEADLLGKYVDKLLAYHPLRTVKPRSKKRRSVARSSSR